MTKIVSEPKKLMDLVRRALVNGQLEAAIFSFSPSGLSTKATKAGTFGGYTTYHSPFFKEYVCEQPVEIKLTKNFLANLESLRFGSEDQISVEIDLPNNRLNILAGKREYHPVLSNPDVQLLSFPFSERPGIGMLPTDTTKPIHFQAKVVADVLGTPKVDKVSYHTVGIELTLELDKDGPYKQTITPSSVLIPRKVTGPDEKTTYTFFVEHMTDILACFVGEVIITMYERVIFITQPDKDQSLMFFTATT